MRGVEFKTAVDADRSLGASVGRNWVHFGYRASFAELPSLLLYRKGTEEVAAELPFPASEAADGIYSMKVQLPAEEYEYNFLDGGRVVTDPYAKRIAGRKVFGADPADSPHGLRGAFLTGRYHWGEDRLPEIPFEDVILYQLHVRGFTMHPQSGVRKPGTFAGLREKISWLKALGVNQVKLMPAYEFAERVRPERPSGAPQTQEEAMARAFEPAVCTPESAAHAAKSVLCAPGAAKSQAGDGRRDSRLNFWGYGPGFYFAPKASYAAGEREDVELKDLVRALHANGMEIILEFAFTDETDIQLICDCLSWWAAEYRIDGFSVLCRDRLFGELARLPLFRSRKLLCGWYPDDATRANRKATGQKLAQQNDGFMNDCRLLLRGDSAYLGAFAWRMRQNPAGCAQINYLTNHDGFTLLDLVSYDHKHNEANGENGRDGTDYNCSWNCGEEGPSAKRGILRLRMQQRKNAYAMLLFSQGTPMLLAGDEFGNSQAGNNNPYCHDSELSWVDWSQKRGGRELTEFVRGAAAYRKAHPVLHQSTELKCLDSLSTGFPDLSYHGERAWYMDQDGTSLHMGCMYSGTYAGESGFLYIAWNFSWEPRTFALPLLPKGMSWFRAMDTSRRNSFRKRGEQENLGNCRSFSAPARTVVILEGRTGTQSCKDA